MKNLAFIGIIMAVFLGGIDASVVVTAINSISNSYSGQVSGVTFVIIAYTVAMTVMAPIAGKLSDMYGSKRVFQFGIILFGVASFLCGMAPDLSSNI